MKNIGIIGHGRFGRIFANLLQQDFSISVYDPDIVTESSGVNFVSLESIAQISVIFLAVPIREFKNLVQQLAPLLTHEHTVIDLCSVKVYPVQIMQQYLPAYVDIIATHPLFGPDSVHKQPLKIVMHSVRNQYGMFAVWENYFQEHDWQVIRMTPAQHDQIAASTQAITHFIGRSLRASEAASSEIDTLGYKKLLQVMEQTCNDSFELFHDMIQYNPYAKQRLTEFLQAAEKLINNSFTIKRG